MPLKLNPIVADVGIVRATGGPQAESRERENAAMSECKYRRRTNIMNEAQCTRRAVKDGFCTRHHPDYISPKDRAALAELDRETDDPVYKAEKRLKEARADHQRALDAISRAQDNEQSCLARVAECQARLDRVKFPELCRSHAPNPCSRHNP